MESLAATADYDLFRNQMLGFFPPPEQHRATVDKLAPGTLPMQCAAIAIGLIDKHYDRKFVSSVPASEMTDVAGLRVGVEFAELDRPDLFQHARRSP